MTDVALIWNAAAFSADLGLAGADLATDDGLRTAIIISLFTDRRARPDDVLPDDTGDSRGWWGDIAPEVDGDLIGSRLWLLSREKRLPSVLARAKEYAQEALAWLVADKVAAAVDVQVEAQASDRLALGITISRPQGQARSRFDFVWSHV